MHLAMPADSPDSSKANAAETLSLILQANNQIAFYNGDDFSNLQYTNYSAAGLRSLIQQKQKLVELSKGDKSKTVILIKPTKNASYKNIVDVLDEMSINNVKRYVLMEENKEETNFLERQ